LPGVADLRSGRVGLQREGLDHTQDLVDLRGVRAAAATEFPDGEVQCAGERSTQRLVGPGLELAGSPAPSDSRRPQRVEQHRLADPAQAGEDERAFGPAAGDAFEDDVECLELTVTAGQFGGTLPGTGRVGVADGIHGATVSGSITLYRDV